MENIVLYNYFRSSTSYRVRIALNLKKLNYEYKPIHLLNNGGEQNQETYRKINPLGGVPTLVHNGFILAQSSAIIEYLDEAFPQPHPLFSTDIKQKSLIRQFCQIINADLHSYSNLKTLQYLEKKLSVSADDRKSWIHHWMKSGLAACEKMLESTAGAYCFKDSVTAADLFLTPHMTTAERFEFDIQQFPRAYKVYQNCLQHPDFVKAHPFRQIDTPPELKI